MSSNERSEIVTQLVADCTFPKATDLEDNTCHICHEASLGRHGAETPIMLRCGHILGMACLTKWAFRQIEEEGNLSPGCPFCRTSLLRGGRPTQDASLQSEENELNFWVQEVSSWTPGGDVQYDNDDTWIQRAESLWDELCNQILDDLGAFDFSHGPAAEIESFLRTALSAERFLSFGTVFHFYQAYFGQG